MKLLNPKRSFMDEILPLAYQVQDINQKINALMEQAKKYYTPSVDEFRVGFEFEKINQITKEYEKDVFSKMDIPDVLCNCEVYKSRVKYLDREDIESLGFTRPEDEAKHGYTYELKNATLKKPDRTELIDIGLIYIPLTNHLLIWQVVNWTHGKQNDTRYCAYCKNKSHLKQILEWINIIPQK